MQKKVITTGRMVFAALMSALYVALNVLSPETAVMRISMLCFLPVVATGMLLGPVWALAPAVLGDVLSCLVKGYAPYIPLTLIAALSALWYGFVLHGRSCTWKVALIAIIPVSLVCEMGLSSWALCVLRHQPFVAVLVQRLWSNLLEIPVKALLMLAVLPAVMRLPKHTLNL